MTRHLIVGSYENALVIAAYNRFVNRAVEEYYRYVLFLGKIHNVLRRVV